MDRLIDVVLSADGEKFILFCLEQIDKGHTAQEVWQLWNRQDE